MTQLNSKKNQKKKQQGKIEEEMEMPFGGETTYYNYRCSDCGYEQKVPDFVVD